MNKINFTKMVASGNDFIVVEKLPHQVSLRKLAREICDRKFGIGADGMLLISKAGLSAISMRIFNADGSEARMCGNGARAVALYAAKKNIDIKTKAGIIKAKVNGDNIRIKLTEPKGLKLDIPVRLGERILRVNFINTGVPHVVIFVSGVEKINVEDLGRYIRNHKIFSPQGTNVNFVEVLNNNSIKVRTYERGVEDETLACGTGSAASALIFGLKAQADKVNVYTQGGEILKVYFNKLKNNFSGVWLEGRAKIICKGEYNV